MSNKIPVKDVSNDDASIVKSFKPQSPSDHSLIDKRPAIYTKLITGFYQNIRSISMYSILLLFIVIPFLRWNERQAILFDIGSRQFYIFGMTFMPQDLFFLAALFMIAAFFLFAITIFAGRVFCGYSCPQTIWTNLFMRVEKLLEGERHQRIRLDKAPWSASKIIRKTLKHIIWLFIAVITATTFVSYFVPVTTLYAHWIHLSIANVLIPFPNISVAAAFFIFLFTVLTYANAGWMRELMCLHVCPYGRFQSAMFDKDTLIISYDTARGEPRGARKKSKTAEILANENLGDCVDCNLCVQVCPTGIDIRDGLQMQCIQCAACVDACNSIMDKLNYPRGLVRYTTERELIEHEKTRWFRPRILGYAAMIVLIFSVFAYSLASRVPLQLDATKDRNQLYNLTMKKQVENSFLLKITNKTQEEKHYRVSLIAPSYFTLSGAETDISLEPGQRFKLPVTVSASLASITGEATAQHTHHDDDEYQSEIEMRFKVVELESAKSSSPIEATHLVKFRAPTQDELEDLDRENEL